MTDVALDHDLPEFREMGVAAVRLLQGVLYADEESAWEILLSNESELTDYFPKSRPCGRDRSGRRAGVSSTTRRR